MVDGAEIERRNRYWFEHWQEFTCQVTVSVPERRQAHVGAFMDGLFGSVPIPFTAHDVEPGSFRFRNGCFEVYTARNTYSWPIRDTRILLSPDGAEVRVPHQPVVKIRGPVAAPLAGAYASAGLLEV